MKHSTGNPAVDQMADINIEGNVIPVNWYQAFKMENGKPDLNAIIILSEIVYWYRPAVVRCEDTGRQLGIKKRFKSDMLQRSYESFSDQFGLSKLQVKEATDRLEKCKVIKKHFRTVGNLSNVLFIELIPAKLLELSSIKSVDSGDTLLRSNVPPSHVQTDDLPRSNVTPPTLEQGTYTENTYREYTEKKKHMYSDDFEKFWNAYPSCPRKTKKQETAKTFEKYRSNFNLDSLLLILELLKKTENWIKQDGEFIPAPNAWLNQKQWENDFWINRINQNHASNTTAQPTASPHPHQEQQPTRFTPERVRYGQGI